MSALVSNYSIRSPKNHISITVSNTALQATSVSKVTKIFHIIIHGSIRSPKNHVSITVSSTALQATSVSEVTKIFHTIFPKQRSLQRSKNDNCGGNNQHISHDFPKTKTLAIIVWNTAPQTISVAEIINIVHTIFPKPSLCRI